MRKSKTLPRPKGGTNGQSFCFDNLLNLQNYKERNFAMKKIISIDHGNRLIKTENLVFPAGFVECGHLPKIGNDVLKYEGKS